jgi:hypothetical protein
MKSQTLKRVIVFTIIISLTFTSCYLIGSKQTSGIEESTLSSTETARELIFYNETHIQLVRKRIKAKDPYFSMNYEEVLKAGIAALEYELDPVTNKTQVPPSNDMHDYLTYAPYRWPDPSKPDGLPWIARDGIINPVSRGADTDFTRKSAFFDAIEKLAWTYYFSEDNRFAEKAIELIKGWYLDPETRVNPNMNFAQGVPGIADGRQAGVHEWKPQAEVITAMQMFEADGILPADIKSGMVDWLNEYLIWLTTDTMAISAGHTRQNHANYYNHQVVGLMIYLGRNQEAKAIVEDAKQSRIADQINPDGTQPREMGRTRSVHYTAGNLWLMTELILLGRKLDVDLWDHETEDGRSIKKAYEYLVPYMLGDKEWTRKEIREGGAEKAIEDLFLPLFSKASTALGVKLIDPEIKTYHKLKPLDVLRYPPRECLPEIR